MEMYKIRIEQDGVMLPAGKIVGFDDSKQQRYRQSIERIAKWPPMFKLTRDIRLLKGMILWVDKLPVDKTCFEKVSSIANYGEPDPEGDEATKAKLEQIKNPRTGRKDADAA